MATGNRFGRQLGAPTDAITATLERAKRTVPAIAAATKTASANPSPAESWCAVSRCRPQTSTKTNTKTQQTALPLGELKSQHLRILSSLAYGMAVFGAPRPYECGWFVLTNMSGRPTHPWVAALAGQSTDRGPLHSLQVTFERMTMRQVIIAGLASCSLLLLGTTSSSSSPRSEEAGSPSGSLPARTVLGLSGNETSTARRPHDGPSTAAMWLVTPKVRLCVPYLAIPAVDPIANRACRSTENSIVLDGPSSELVENQLHK
jgi:hypothetical protein